MAKTQWSTQKNLPIIKKNLQYICLLKGFLAHLLVCNRERIANHSIIHLAVVVCHKWGSAIMMKHQWSDEKVIFLLQPGPQKIYVSTLRDQYVSFYVGQFTHNTSLIISYQETILWIWTLNWYPHWNHKAAFNTQL